jgi:hypothetical protein
MQLLDRLDRPNTSTNRQQHTLYIDHHITEETPHKHMTKDLNATTRKDEKRPSSIRESFP